MRQKNGQGWIARCPAHDDRNPSLSVSIGDGGRTLLCCHAGCTAGKIVRAIGLTTRDRFASNAKRVTPRSQRKVYRDWVAIGNAVRRELKQRDALVTRYTYSTSFFVLRFDLPDGNKTCRPIHRTSTGWAIGDPPGKLPLYRVDDARKANVVYVVEGEKACDAACSIGLVAVTSAHGSQSAARSDWLPLAGKQVVILPDNDCAGMRYATDVARILNALECSIKIVKIANLPDGGNVADLVKDCSDNQDAHDIARDVAEQAERTAAWTPEAVAPDDAELSPPIPWRPFPVDVLPEPLRSVVSEGATSLGCDPSMIALPMLVVVASCIGAGYVIELKKDWIEYAVLWSCVIAESGTLKTPAWKLATRPLEELQGERFREHAVAMCDYEKRLIRHKQRAKKKELLMLVYLIEQR